MEMSMTFIPGAKYYKCNINIPNQNEIQKHSIYEYYLNMIRNAENRLDDIKVNIDDIRLTIQYRYEKPHLLYKVYILEGEYISEFVISCNENCDVIYKLRHIYKLSKDMVAKITLLNCREKLTQKQLINMMDKCQIIL